MKAESLEKEEKRRAENPSRRGKRRELAIALSPFFFGILAVLEYFYVPNHEGFSASYVYAAFLALLLLGNLLSFCLSFRSVKARKNYLYHAPFRALVFFLLLSYDLLTLKSNILIMPYFPSIDQVLSAMLKDRVYLLQCTGSSLFLLFSGYFLGVLVGLLTGIACGYNKKVEYWVAPFLKLLGAIPSTTWIPIVMVLATSLFRGSVFIIALGVWFSVTLSTITGIHNIDKAYYEAAKTLGAKERDLVLRIAIPSALPSIFQGLVQAMSSACMALMIAEMIGVESGLGWYITWQKSWAEYGKMYGAIILICVIFVSVNFILNQIKSRVLRWQEGLVK